MGQAARVIDIKEFDVDVAEPPDRHTAAEKGDARQKIPGDFLGPGERVVEGIPGEELQEDDDSQDPEEDQGHPILRTIFLEVYLGFVAGPDDRRAEIGAAIAFFCHGVAPPGSS